MSKTDWSPVQKLWEKSDFILFREASPVGTESLLVLAPISERPSPVTIRRLEYLHSLREKLDPAFFTRPLAIVWQDGRPALLLEDPGGTVLEQSRPLMLKVALKLGIGVAPSRSRLGAWEVSGVRHSRNIQQFVQQGASKVTASTIRVSPLKRQFIGCECRCEEGLMEPM